MHVDSTKSQIRCIMSLFFSMLQDIAVYRTNILSSNFNQAEEFYFEKIEVNLANLAISCIK